MASLPSPASHLAERLARGRSTWHPAAATALAALPGFVVLLAVALPLGFLVRDVLDSTVVGEWDVEIARWFAERRTPTLNTVSYIGSSLAGIWEVPVGMALSVGALFWLRHWWWGAFLMVAILLEGALYTSITFVFARERPAVHRLEDLIHDDSFPSGHTAAGVVMYAGIAVVVTAATQNRAWRAVAWSAAILIPAFVAWSRLSRGMHYLTDSVVGVCIGAGCIVAALFAVRVGELVAGRRATQGVSSTA